MRYPHSTVHGVLIGCLLLASATVARADSFAGLATPDYAAPGRVKQRDPITSWHVRHLSYPVLGFPSLVEPGGRIPARVLLPDGGRTGDFAAELVTQASVPVRATLRPTGVRTYDAATGTYVVELEVPSGTAPGVYDLVLTSASFALPNHADRQPCSVRVLDARHLDQGFAVIADTQAQDIRTTVIPQRIAELLSEVRLRDPAFVVFCGDANFGTDYSTEYEENWNLFARSGLAVFMVPGNHDGYATVLPDGSGTRVDRDGIEQWRVTFGPTLFSFDWGKHHFVGVNSSGGDPIRRNAFGVIVTNYGGHVDAADLAWIEADVRDAAARGKRSVLFMHHDPGGKLVPERSAYPFPVPMFQSQDWNDATSQRELDRIVATQPVSHLLYGHVHHDGYRERPLGGRNVPFVATTTLCCGAASRFGYRWVSTRAGAIEDLHYLGAKQQSVPFPASGVNVEAALSAPNDGSASALTATVTNRLLAPVSVTLDLAVQGGAAPRARNGVLESVTAAGGVLVARVRGLVPASGSLDLGVEAGPRPGPATTVTPGSVAAATTGTAPGATAAPAPTGRGASGCALAPGGGGGEGWVVLLVVGAFLGWRRRRHFG